MPFSYVLYDRLDLSRTLQGSHEEVAVGVVKLKVMGSRLCFYSLHVSFLPSAWGRCRTSAVLHTWAGEPACQRVSLWLVVGTGIQKGLQGKGSPGF